MEKSTHRAEVVPVELLPHPNADSLSIIKVFGYTVVGKTADWRGIDRAIYVVPDSLVDTDREEFKWLKKEGGTSSFHRVKVIKLRGIISMGLLIPAPADAVIGDDYAERLGITRYEPPIKLTGGFDENVGAPSGLYAPKYDIDSYHRYLDVMVDGEPVYISEKIHGANARYVMVDGQQYCGSRTEWKKEKENNLWWRALNNTPSIREFCEKNEGVILYGEVYGQVQTLKYGLNDVAFAAFDILTKEGWMNAGQFVETCGQWNIPTVPLISIGEPLDKSKVLELAEGQSLFKGANHVREGVVVKPMIERQSDEIGRVILKIVGNGYYEKVK